MNSVVQGRCSASSAKGKSSTETCIRTGRQDGDELLLEAPNSSGTATLSGKTDKTCVILYFSNSAGFSANARSDIKRFGTISEAVEG